MLKEFVSISYLDKLLRRDIDFGLRWDKLRIFHPKFGTRLLFPKNREIYICCFSGLLFTIHPVEISTFRVQYLRVKDFCLTTGEQQIIISTYFHSCWRSLGCDIAEDRGTRQTVIAATLLLSLVAILFGLLVETLKFSGVLQQIELNFPRKICFISIYKSIFELCF